MSQVSEDVPDGDTTANPDQRPLSRNDGAESASRHVRVAIIGTGFSGLGMAIRLKQQGMTDFAILERAADVGGTWRDNTYPGCACDVPSHLYSFSFALNPNWSHAYAPQPEIWDYLRACAKQFDLEAYIHWNCELRAATWDDAVQLWRISTTQGNFTAAILIAGQGPLSEPATPAIAGVERFAGTSFHSATWDHQHDLRGERVAVIGTGASAIQFIPRIQPQVGHLTLYQRTPPWIMPRNDHPIKQWQQVLYRRLPVAQRVMRTLIYWQREFAALAFVYRPQLLSAVQRQALKHLASQVADPDLRAKLTPTYTMGCKRILLSDDFYPALTQSNVSMVTTPIREVRAHSIVTADGEEHHVDTLVFATGFHVTDMPIAARIAGHGGQTLAASWGTSVQAYLGTTVAGFPNLFLLIGPNTGLGHNSMVYMIESQLAYILDGLKLMERQQIQAIEVIPEKQAEYNDMVQRKMQGTVWASGCKSWYLDARGRNSTIWPGFTFAFRRLTRHFDAQSYHTSGVLHTVPTTHG